jgi:hypothetical protein
MRYVGILLLFTACTSSVQTVDTPTTFTVPADSGYGYMYGPEVPIVVNPDCDSAKVAAMILERALNDIYGQIDGYIVDIDLTLQNMGKKDELIGGLRRQVETLRGKIEVLVREKEKQAPVPKEWRDKYEALAKDNAHLRENQESHSFFWFVGAFLSVFLAGCLAGFIGPKLLAFRGL